jgi:predicted  nucleic acid-binding Zn-ribbon protein
MKALFTVIVAAFVLGACQTMKSAPPASMEALEYRDIQGEAQKQQTELAITGVKINAESRGIVEGIKELEKDMVSTPEGSLWLPQIQELRGRAEGLRGEAEKLNIQLEAERETNGRLTAQFNAYEAAQEKAISERDTEIAVLRVKNGKVKGQRNTLLAIVITAVSIIILYLIFTILRRLKIIPF